MREWDALSQRAQVRRLARLARRGIAHWPLTDPTLTPIDHGENATFRVRAVEGEFLLRVHRHKYRTRAMIGSELAWLAFARAHGLPVPEPVRTRDDAWVAEDGSAEVPHRRHLTLLRWLDGRMHWRHPKPVRAQRIGTLLARLHDAAEAFSPPPDFVRPTLDLDGSLHGGFGDVAAVPWLTDSQRDLVAQTEAALHRDLASMPAVDAILVHADLHLGNVLFANGEARAIDFDDMGWGAPSLDLSVPWNNLHEQGTPGQLCEALLDGYAAHRPLPDHCERRLALWGTLRELTVLAWIADRTDIADLADRRQHVTARVLTRCKRYVQAR